MGAALTHVHRFQLAVGGGEVGFDRGDFAEPAMLIADRARRDAVADQDVRGVVPGAVSRWTGGRNLGWEPLRPELVVEVAYEAMEGDRFRHTAHFQRWRPDREPESCTYEQLDRPVRFDVDEALGGGRVA